MHSASTVGISCHFYSGSYCITRTIRRTNQFSLVRKRLRVLEQDRTACGICTCVQPSQWERNDLLGCWFITTKQCAFCPFFFATQFVFQRQFTFPPVVDVAWKFCPFDDEQFRWYTLLLAAPGFPLAAQCGTCNDNAARIPVIQRDCSIVEQRRTRQTGTGVQFSNTT